MSWCSVECRNNSTKWKNPLAAGGVSLAAALVVAAAVAAAAASARGAGGVPGMLGGRDGVPAPAPSPVTRRLPPDTSRPLLCE